VVAQQVVERRAGRHDAMRTLRVSVYGGCVFSPIAAVWFGRVLERVRLASRGATIAARVALDQSCASPTFCALFFGTTTLLEGGSPADARRKVQQVCTTPRRQHKPR
jgi:protein Mpv17